MNNENKDKSKKYTRFQLQLKTHILFMLQVLK